MNWTFQKKLTSAMMFLLTFVVLGLSFFFFKFYSQEKVAELLENERINLSRATTHLEYLLQLVDVIALENVRFSKEIIFLVEGVCQNSRPSQVVVSKNFEKHLQDLELDPTHWLNSLEIYESCKIFQNQDAHTPRVLVIPNSIQLMVPYIQVLIFEEQSARLALFSMDGFQTSASSTLFLMDANNKVIWASDGTEFLSTAFQDTRVHLESINPIVKKARELHTIQIAEFGWTGLLSVLSTNSNWVMASLSYQPAVYKPVFYALRQFLWLVLGFLFLVLFLGRKFSSYITKPLLELQQSAEQLGQGHFNKKFEITGHDEISTVKLAFNQMTHRLVGLIEEKKQSTKIEYELNLAQQMQKLLLPNSTFQSGAHRFDSVVQYASQCGGDWWGQLEVQLKDQRFVSVVMIGDATSHGVSSALITAAVRGGLSVLAKWIEKDKRMEIDPCLILSFLNQAIFDAAQGSITMTFFVAILDPTKGVIRYANAGHPFPYLFIPATAGQQMEIRALGFAGVPLGESKDTFYQKEEQVSWETGYKLFLFTDGLIDCTENQISLFNRRILRRILQSSENLKGKRLLDRVLEHRKKYIGNRDFGDDLTAVVCQIKEKGI